MLVTEIRPGDQIGSYAIVRRIGAGGMGEVFLARHRVLGWTAAIKVLRPDVSYVPEVVGRFISEARAAARVRHPGIVEILDCDITEGGRAFLVMEFLRGENLREALGRDPSLRHDTRFIASVIGAAADALEVAHANGVVHRDLKPDNIFLSLAKSDTSRLQVKILDFGVAKLLQPDMTGARTQTGALLGTPHYMSPEQCRGAGNIDHRSDIYSLGCVAFEMLAGKLPFKPDSVGMLLISHATEEPPTLNSVAPGVPAPLCALVDGMLVKDPAGRPQSMGEVAETLAAYLGTARSSISNQLRVPINFPLDKGGEPDGLQSTAPPVAPVPSGSNAVRPKQASTFNGSATELPVQTVSRGSRPSWMLPTSLGAGALLVGVLFTLLRGAAPSPLLPDQAKVPVAVEPVVLEPESAHLPVAEVDVVVDSRPAGAEVWLAGESTSRGKTPLSFKVSRADAPADASLRLTAHEPLSFTFSRKANANLLFQMQPVSASPSKRAKMPRPATQKRRPPPKKIPIKALVIELKTLLSLMVSVFLVAFVARPVMADKRTAKAHYEDGTRAYNLGRFPEAIASFEKAYEEDPAAILLFNIAQSHRQLGNHDRALFFYRRYLEADPQSKNRASVERRMEEIRVAQASEQVNAVSPPSPAAVPEKLGDGSRSPVSPTSASVATSPEPKPAPSVSDKQSSDRSGFGLLRWSAYTAGGVGVASIATGIVFGSMAASEGNTQSEAKTFDPDADAAGKQKETLQYVFLGVGAAALATGLVLYMVDLKVAHESVALVPVVSGDATGLLARMRF
jgi:eukaryotic-like serine/threonine-protein kinase